MSSRPPFWRGRRGLALVCPALLAVSCVASPGIRPGSDEGPPPVESIGRFEVSSAAVSRGIIVPTRCDAGDGEQFLGGDLRDESLGVTVRLVVDPLYGPALRVYDTRAPFERSVLFFEEECERFELSLVPTGEEINSIVVRELELEVDCENEEGATIYGRAAARCD